MRRGQDDRHRTHRVHVHRIKIWARLPGGATRAKRDGWIKGPARPPGDATGAKTDVHTDSVIFFFCVTFVFVVSLLFMKKYSFGSTQITGDPKTSLFVNTEVTLKKLLSIHNAKIFPRKYLFWVIYVFVTIKGLNGTASRWGVEAQA